eukprot:1764061-Prymnesium_polylepis.1
MSWLLTWPHLDIHALFTPPLIHSSTHPFILPPNAFCRDLTKTPPPLNSSTHPLIHSSTPSTHPLRMGRVVAHRARWSDGGRARLAFSYSSYSSTHPLIHSSALALLRLHPFSARPTMGSTRRMSCAPTSMIRRCAATAAVTPHSRLPREPPHARACCMSFSRWRYRGVTSRRNPMSG